MAPLENIPNNRVGLNTERFIASAPLSRRTVSEDQVPMETTNKYSKEKVFIENYWQRVLATPEKQPNGIDAKTGRLELPYSFYPPNEGRWGAVQFYWDNQSIIEDAVTTPSRIPIAVGIVENFVYMFDKFGAIPNASSEAFLLSSQPPLLTSMIMNVYQALPQEGVVKARRGEDLFSVAEDRNKWLEKVMDTAKKEYAEVWMHERDFQEALGNSHHRQEGTGLSRYGDRDAGYSFNAERESGWDFTSRFANRCADFLPIDLNCYLYKYEKDFADAARILGKDEEAEIWNNKAEERRIEVNRLMWDEERGFFFDFDWKKAQSGMTSFSRKVPSTELTSEQINESRSVFYSLAGFAPMWAGLATPTQAEKMLANITKFETQQGLTITAEECTPKENQYNLSMIPEFQRESIVRSLAPKQWDYPHIWPPLELQVVQGLLTYGFKDKAKDIMKCFLNSESQVFARNTIEDQQLGFGEKRSALISQEKREEKDFQYKHQTGFSWTCAVFDIFLRELQKFEN